MLVMIDLDNTLGDRSGTVRCWIDEFCNEQSLPAGSAEWLVDIDNDGYSARHDVFEAIRERFGLPSPVDELLARYQKRVIELSELLPGAKDCLSDMRKRGWNVAIVSNGSSQQQHGKIGKLGIAGLVDAVVISGDLAIKKPDARIFEHAASLMSADLDGAWMVGDSPLHDIVGASELGVQTAWLRRGRVWPRTNVHPTIIIDSLRELVPALDALAAK